MSRQKIPIRPLEDYAPGGSATTEGIFVGRFDQITRRLSNRLRLHRHEYFEVFLLDGAGVHFNDFAAYPLSGMMLVFTSPGQAHAWEHAPSLTGYSVCFTQEFFDGAAPPPSAILRHPFWFPAGTPPCLSVPEGQREDFDHLFRDIHDEFTRREAGFGEVISHLLRVVFLRANRLYPGAAGTGAEENREIFQRFRIALEEHFRTEQSVDAYCELLGVSATTLRGVVRRHSGKSAAEMIRERLLLEARRLLAHTSLGIAEIAYELRFRDPSYFSRFFRRLTGVSPGDFRIAQEGTVDGPTAFPG